MRLSSTAAETLSDVAYRNGQSCNEYSTIRTPSGPVVGAPFLATSLAVLSSLFGTNVMLTDVPDYPVCWLLRHGFGHLMGVGIAAVSRLHGPTAGGLWTARGNNHSIRSMWPQKPVRRSAFRSTGPQMITGFLSR
jgi:hypothetical protein